MTTELNLDFSSSEESALSTTVRSALFSSEITTTIANFLSESVENDPDQGTEEVVLEDLSNLNEELLTFQSGFMPTPFAKRSKNKTSSEGKITHRRIRVRINEFFLS